MREFHNAKVFSLRPCLYAPMPYGKSSPSISYRSKGSSGFTISGRRFRYFSMSNSFFLSKSDRNLYLGCFVISNLSLKKGRAPRTCKIHLPPSMTDISSWLISSMQHCQVMSLILRTKKAATLSNLYFPSHYFNFYNQKDVLCNIISRFCTKVLPVSL